MTLKPELGIAWRSSRQKAGMSNDLIEEMAGPLRWSWVWNTFAIAQTARPASGGRGA